MAAKDFLLALGGPAAQQAYQAKRERTAMEALGQYLKPGGDPAALGRVYEADPVLAMKAQGMQQEQQKTQMGLDSEQRRRVGAIAKFIHAAPQEKRPAAYMSALPTLRQVFPNQPLPEQYGPEVEQAMYSIMGLSAGDTGVGIGNGVQSTYLDAQGNRVAVMRDGSMQTLGAADTGMSNQTVEVAGEDGKTRTMTFNKRTGRYEPPNTGQSRPPSNVQIDLAAGTSPEIAQAIQAYAMADQQSSQPFPQQVADQSALFTSRAPEETAYRTEQAKNRAAREQMPYETEQARAVETAKAQASADVTRQNNEPQRQEKTRQQINSIDSVVTSIDRAVGKVNWATAGAIGKVSSWTPGSPAYGLSKALQTVKANIGFDRLQQMRDASPTGGALGQVAIQELDALQASIASLDQFQDPEDLEYGLKQVKRHYEGWKDAVKQADMRARQRVQGGEQKAQAMQGAPSNIDSLLDKYR